MPPYCVCLNVLSNYSFGLKLAVYSRSNMRQSRSVTHYIHHRRKNIEWKSTFKLCVCVYSVHMRWNRWKAKIAKRRETGERTNTSTRSNGLFLFAVIELRIFVYLFAIQLKLLLWALCWKDECPFLVSFFLSFLCCSFFHWNLRE